VSVDLSGVIFVLLALAWAVYLIPKALKHHDEVARTRSIDRFSNAMRVLARREPVSEGRSRLVVTPARPADMPRILLPARPARPDRLANPLAARRAAAKAAARRRRRVLLLLFLGDAAVTALAAYALLPWWSVAAPASLTLLFLVLCRTQVRREVQAPLTRDVRARDRSAAAPRRAVRVDTQYPTPREGRSVGSTGVGSTAAGSPGAASTGAAWSGAADPDEDTVPIPLTAEEPAAAAVPTTDGGSLWDPLPVTLPTYVHKPKAARTVRTINLGEPGAWTSGRSESDSRLVEDAASVEEETVDQDDQRAVGS
jgi:hypothetical protein